MAVEQAEHERIGQKNSETLQMYPVGCFVLNEPKTIGGIVTNYSSNLPGGEISHLCVSNVTAIITTTEQLMGHHLPDVKWKISEAFRFAQPRIGQLPRVVRQALRRS